MNRTPSDRTEFAILGLLCASAVPSFLTVQLIETSPAGEPSAIIGQQVIPNPQVPIKFEVHFDPVAIRPEATYLLEANISVNHTLWFENDSRYEIDPLTAGPETLVLEMLKKPGAEDSSKGP